MNNMKLMKENPLISEAATAMQKKPYMCIYPNCEWLASLSEDELCQFILNEWLNRHLDNDGWF